MAQVTSVWLVYNATSGSNDEAALDALTRAFAESCMTIAGRTCFPDDEPPQADRLDRDEIRTVAIFAGDGTINSVVTGLYGWGGSILVLPGGTMNLLSKALHGDEEPGAIVAKVAQGAGVPTRPPTIECACGIGFAGVIAGPGTAWYDVREAMRDSDVMETVSATTEAIEESTAGARVLCAQPACGRDEGYQAIVLGPTREGIEATGYFADNLMEYAKQGAAIVQRDFRSGPHEAIGTRDSLTLRSADGTPMGLLVDGESCDPVPEMTFTVGECGVDMIATATSRPSPGKQERPS